MYFDWIQGLMSLIQLIVPEDSDLIPVGVLLYRLCFLLAMDWVCDGIWVFAWVSFRSISFRLFDFGLVRSFHSFHFGSPLFAS